MKTYASKLLQAIGLWMVLSSCFHCCWKRNSTHASSPHHASQLPEVQISLQVSQSTYFPPTISTLLVEAYSQYYNIIQVHAKFIQPSTSTASILQLENQLGILQGMHEALCSPLLAASPEIIEIFEHKLHTVQDIQMKQQTMITECAAQLKKAPTQVSPEEKLFLQAQQELCTQICSISSQLIEKLEEATRNNMVVVN